MGYYIEDTVELDARVQSLVMGEDLIQYEGLGVLEKLIHLGRAERLFDGLRWSGMYVERGQGHAFPRYIGNRRIGCDDNVLKMAVTLIVVESIRKECSQRQKLMSEGVTSIGVGKLKETYSVSGAKEVPDDVRYLLRGYLFDGVVGG